MKEALTLQTSTAIAKEIGASIVEFRKKANSAAALELELVRESRTIGLQILAWSDGQLTFSFWKFHRRELPPVCTFATMQKFVSVARKLPESPKGFQDARKVMQASFESAGLIELPPPREPQKQVAMSHFAELVSAIARVRDVLVRFNRDQPIETWDEQMRASVRLQIQPLAELHAQLSPPVT